MAFDPAVEDVGPAPAAVAALAIPPDLITNLAQEIGPAVISSPPSGEIDRARKGSRNGAGVRPSGLLAKS